MSKFIELRQNTPKLTIKEGAREVIFKTISCMCDNVGHLRFKKNSEGDFKYLQIFQDLVVLLLFYLLYFA